MSGWVPGAQWLTDKLIGILDEFIEIPNSDVLRVGVLKGLVKLTDVVRRWHQYHSHISTINLMQIKCLQPARPTRLQKLRPHVLNDLDLPLELETATIGLLQIEVPWTKILTARVSVTVRDVACRFHAQLDSEAAAEGEPGTRSLPTVPPQNYHRCV